jgi:hypothetical protein
MFSGGTNIPVKKVVTGKITRKTQWVKVTQVLMFLFSSLNQTNYPTTLGSCKWLLVGLLRGR